MFANVNQITYKPGSPRESTKSTWRALIEQQPGFRGFLGLAHDDNRATIITLWDSREAAAAWRENPDYQSWARQELQPAVAEWSITPGTVDAAQLRDINV